MKSTDNSYWRTSVVFQENLTGMKLGLVFIVLDCSLEAISNHRSMRSSPGVCLLVLIRYRNLTTPARQGHWEPILAQLFQVV